MKHTSSTQLRANLSKLMDQVNDDHEPLIVTRANGKPVVILSLEDYDAMDETAYLLSSPANAKALHDAIHRLDNGQSITKTMEELEAMAQE
ncbi:MAG: type II toxin-antitoxin system prevent-host-death family antitoxin [Rhodobacteraceae bacterium]|nr:type II toxin-antitoxin system prevent-host-death family antitoxin [Paracoccaceae bacterium]